MSTVAATASSQNATLPDIPELYNPNFLDVLLPPVDVKVPDVVTESKQPSGSTARNPMMDALQSTANQAFTTNLAPAYSSTGSATLDAFQFLSGHCSMSQMNAYLKDAWAEDASLTLRIIWNLRSIHDGKGDKETFYRYVFTLFLYHELSIELVCLAHLAGYTKIIHELPFPTSIS